MLSLLIPAKIKHSKVIGKDSHVKITSAIIYRHLFCKVLLTEDEKQTALLQHMSTTAGVATVLRQEASNSNCFADSPKVATQIKLTKLSFDIQELNENHWCLQCDGPKNRFHFPSLVIAYITLFFLLICDDLQKSIKPDKEGDEKVEKKPRFNFLGPQRRPSRIESGNRVCLCEGAWIE